jgi:hypothetical protein
MEFLFGVRRMDSQRELKRCRLDQVLNDRAVANTQPYECAAMSSARESLGKKHVSAPGTGCSFPLGATLVTGGANFSVFSRSAASIELLFFDYVDDARPSRVIPIDPAANRTYHYWHVFVPGIEAGQIYGFRAYGPFEPDRGLRFDPSKLLLDPYGAGRSPCRINIAVRRLAARATTPQPP